jgi:hypothetical protein
MLGDGGQFDGSRGGALGDEYFADLRLRQVAVAFLIGVGDGAVGGLLGGRVAGEDFEVGEGFVVLDLMDEVFVVVTQPVPMVNLLVLIHNFIVSICH